MKDSPLFWQCALGAIAILGMTLVFATASRSADPRWRASQLLETPLNAGKCVQVSANGKNLTSTSQPCRTSGAGTEEAYLQAKLEFDETLASVGTDYSCTPFGVDSGSAIVVSDQFSEVSEGVYEYTGTVDSTGYRQFKATWTGTIYHYSTWTQQVKTYVQYKPDGGAWTDAEHETLNDQNAYVSAFGNYIYNSVVSGQTILSLAEDAEVRINFCAKRLAGSGNVVVATSTVNPDGFSLILTPIGSTGDAE